MSRTTDAIADFKAILQNGFIKNGRQFFGTDSGEILSVTGFDGNAVGFDVRDDVDATDGPKLAPIVFIHRVDPAHERLIGGCKRNTLLFTISLIIKNQTKVVGASTLSASALSRYLMDEFQDGLEASPGQWTNTKVTQVDFDGDEGGGKLGTTTFYGFTADVLVTFN